MHKTPRNNRKILQNAKIPSEIFANGVEILNIVFSRYCEEINHCAGEILAKMLNSLLTTIFRQDVNYKGAQISFIVRVEILNKAKKIDRWL